MIDYNAVRVGQKLRITGIGARGFAQLGDIVTVESVKSNRVDVVHDASGERAYFALSCGAARLEPVTDAETQPVVDAVDPVAEAQHSPSTREKKSANSVLLQD